MIFVSSAIIAYSVSQSMDLGLLGFTFSQLSVKKWTNLHSSNVNYHQHPWDETQHQIQGAQSP